MRTDSQKAALARARVMLKVAAQYISETWPEGTIFYDDAECDGYCVADDCKQAQEELEYQFREPS